MLDDYLLKASLPRLSVNKLIRLCLLADRFHINLLRSAYVKALGDRINLDCIVEVSNLCN